MEKDIKDLEQQALEFCRKYKVAITLETITVGRNENGELLAGYITSEIID